MILLPHTEAAACKRKCCCKRSGYQSTYNRSSYKKSICKKRVTREGLQAEKGCKRSEAVTREEQQLREKCSGYKRIEVIIIEEKNL